LKKLIFFDALKSIFLISVLSKNPAFFKLYLFTKTNDEGSCDFEYWKKNKTALHYWNKLHLKRYNRFLLYVTT